MLEPSLIVVEDDDELCRLLVAGLTELGFTVEGASSGASLLVRAGERRFDAMVVDIGLPDADGRDVCQALRARGDDTPVLFLTARDALPDRIAGFEAGGDDYVTKPFALAEVAARLRALLRRGAADAAIEVGALRLDPTVHAASCGDVSTRLTPTEFRLLGALAARAGQAVRRRELVAAGWPYGAMVSENTLDAYVARLRRKLRTLPGAPSIDTVRGVGYTLR